MTISKLLPAVCAFALGATCVTVRADDNPAQAAARIALAKQLFALDAQQPPATNKVAATPAVAPKKTMQKTQAPNIQATPKTTDDNVVMTPINPAAAKADKAKAKAEKAAAAAKAKQDAAQAAADLKAKKEAEKKLAAQRATDAKTTANQAAANAAAKADTDKQLAAQKAALVAALANRPVTETKPTTQPVPPPAAVAKAEPAAQPVKTADVNFAGKDLGMKPMEAPALPISSSKEDQLQALLAKYKADQITPEEYHKQRAAILAQP
jgi:hypothetical protein